MAEYNIIKAAQAQEDFCASKSTLNFVKFGHCFSCGNNVFAQVFHPNRKFNQYTGVTVEEAGTALITGCPHCNRSFVE